MTGVAYNEVKSAGDYVALQGVLTSQGRNSPGTGPHGAEYIRNGARGKEYIL